MPAASICRRSWSVVRPRVLGCGYPHKKGLRVRHSVPIRLARRTTVDRGEKNQEPYVKRVTLPSGKSIEVLYFAEQPVATAPVTEPAQPAGDQPLHVCVECESS